MNETTYHYSYLAANAATQVKTGTGKLHSVVINTAGASSNVITLYDGTDTNGTVIAVIDGTAAAGNILLYDVQFITGLHVVIGTGTAAKITISYL